MDAQRHTIQFLWPLGASAQAAFSVANMTFQLRVVSQITLKGDAVSLWLARLSLTPSTCSCMCICGFVCMHMRVFWHTSYIYAPYIDPSELECPSLLTCRSVFQLMFLLMLLA